jgi:nicotinamidase-related amidase
VIRPAIPAEEIAVSQALLIIDPQNDYFPGGAFPLWNAEACLANLERAATEARAQGRPVILVQHVASPGPGPFFNEGSLGVQLHPRILAAAPGAPVVVKHYADAFHQTDLLATLDRLGVTGLTVAGMMTQNCVTHTLLSRAADTYELAVWADGCTTVSEILHRIAIHALSTRVKVL